MSKVICPLIFSLFLAGNAFTQTSGKITHVDYDLQGGTNHPANISSYECIGLDGGWLELQPPTKEGYEFMGWYLDSDKFGGNYKMDGISLCNSYYLSEDNRISVYARWGVISKRPERDASGCIHVHDAAELYGAVKIADSLMKNFNEVCISIEDDIVVNKDLLAADGSLNDGDHFWWNPIEGFFSGIIEGNGHTISGLYGNVAFIDEVYQAKIQNLGIIDSYFEGYRVASFALTSSALSLKNVFSTATLVSTSAYAVGGLIGMVSSVGDACLDDDLGMGYVYDRPPMPRSKYIVLPFYSTSIENSYYTGRMSGKNGGGLVGEADLISIKNSFFAGTADINEDFSPIAKKMEKMCTELPEDAHSYENVFYLDGYGASNPGATPMSASNFIDGTVLANLLNGSEYAIWSQNIGKDAYPKLNAPYFDITYNLNGGENDASNPKYYTPEQEVALKPATKEGDVFEGWFADSNFTIPIMATPTSANGNQEYYAKWESGYSITYISDGAYYNEMSRNPSYRYADSATYLLKDPWDIDGGARTFAGWYADSTFMVRVTELRTGNTEDIVLYAKWIRRKIQIIYSLNGGDITEGYYPLEVLNGDTIPLKAPARDGYLFQGWFGSNRIEEHKLGEAEQLYVVNTRNDYEYISAKWIIAPAKPAQDADGCYMVTNPNELYYFNEVANEVIGVKPPANSCIKIMNDIFVNPGYTHSYSESSDWYPMNLNDPFIGTIYGNGHTIYGLYMPYSYPDANPFYGLVMNWPNNGAYPEVRDLFIENSTYGQITYDCKVPINVKGGPFVSIPKKAIPAKGKMERARKYDIKGRNPKSRPHYGVYF